MWKDLTRRGATVAVAATLAFGAAACNGGVDVEGDSVEEAPLEGTEDPVIEGSEPVVETPQ